MNKKKKKAFTLTELLIVVVVVAGLAAVAVPQYKKVVEARKVGEAEAVLTAVRTEQERRCALGKSYATLGQLQKSSLVPTTEKQIAKSFKYSSGSQSLSAESQGSYKYTLKVASYRDGRICCSGPDCSRFNYPDCDQGLGEVARGDECQTAEDDTPVTIAMARPCDGKAVPQPKQSSQTATCEAGFTGDRTRSVTTVYSCNPETGAIFGTDQYGTWDESDCKPIPCYHVVVPSPSVSSEQESCDGGYTGNKTRTKTITYSCNPNTEEIESSVSYGGWDTSNCSKIACYGQTIPDKTGTYEETECDKGYKGIKRRKKTTEYFCDAASDTVKSVVTYGEWETGECKETDPDPCADKVLPEDIYVTESEPCGDGLTGEKTRTKRTTYTCDVAKGMIETIVDYSTWDTSKCAVDPKNMKDPCEDVTIPPSNIETENETCGSGYTGFLKRTKTTTYSCNSSTGEIESSVSYSKWDLSDCKAKDLCENVKVPETETAKEKEACDSGYTGDKTRTKTTTYYCDSSDGKVKSSTSYGSWDKSGCVAIPTDPCAGVSVPEAKSEKEEANCDAGYTGKKSRTKTTTYSCNSSTGQVESKESFSGWDSSSCSKIPCYGQKIPDTSTETEKEACGAGYTGDKTRTKTTTYACNATTDKVESSVSYSDWNKSGCSKIPCYGQKIPTATTETETQECGGSYIGNKTRTKTTTYACDAATDKVESTVSYGTWNTKDCKSYHFESVADGRYVCDGSECEKDWCNGSSSFCSTLKEATYSSQITANGCRAVASTYGDDGMCYSGSSANDIKVSCSSSNKDKYFGVFGSRSNGSERSFWVHVYKCVLS